MLHVFFGNNEVTIREKAHALIHSFDQPSVSIITVSPETYSEGYIVELAQSTSLFNGTQIVVLDMLGEKKETLACVLTQLSLIKESPNQFVCIEGSITSVEKKVLATYADTVEEVKIEKKEVFNTFSLTDALLRRDKKSLWFLLMKAWETNLSPEEVIGVLFWQVKILRLVERTKNADDAGQKPFVYKKAKEALLRFKKGEIDQMSRDLLRMYHEGHTVKCDTEIELEKWILKM